MDRIVAILHNNDSMNDNVHATVKMILDNACASQVYVFTAQPNAAFNIANGTQICINVTWPSECNTVPKIRNWINSFFKTNNFKGMLHVLEDNTRILKIPTGFLADLEHMMDILEYDVWFSTICDTCNYVYAKYNPRLAIVLDKAEYLSLNLGKKLIFTSHSNTQWIAYNFSRATNDQLHFDEDFTVPMFYIIEYLARRRNNKKPHQLYYMNQYLTVESEYKVFEQCVELPTNVSEETMQKENDLFKSKNFNYDSNNDIDLILETLYANMNMKLQEQSK